MMTKTIKLTTRAAISWLDHLALPPAIVITVLVLFVAAGVAALGRLSTQASAVAIPTPSLQQSIYIIATAQPQPTPDQQLLQEVERLRTRVAELESLQAAAPVSAPVVDQPAEIAPPTPEIVAAPANEPTDAERWVSDSTPNSDYIDQSIVVVSESEQPDVNAKSHIQAPAGVSDGRSQ